MTENEYKPINDKSRLKLQGNLYIDIDSNYIENIVTHLENNNIKKPYNVLDAGCGFGYMTKKVFGNDDRFNVVGIDKSKKVIEKAKSNYNADNITYKSIDINNINNLYNEHFHIVYSTFMLHHLPNANEVISKLWNTMSNKAGVIYVRSVEDDLRCRYPEIENLNMLVESSNDVFNIDRKQGRKLYSYMSELNPRPSEIEIDFHEHNTSNMSLEEQKIHFDVFYSYRINPFKRQYNKPNSTKEDKKEYEKMKKCLQYCRREFETNPNLLDILFIPICVAYK